MIPKESLQFLKELKQNNNRDWFQSQKKRYETYKANYYALAQQFLEELKKYDPALAQLEVKNCVFRINRDIRFSKNKQPYKTNMAFWFSPGNKNWNQAGYYVHVEPGASFVAGGFYQPLPEELKKIRTEIAFFQDELEAILAEKNFKSVFGDLDRTDTLKKAPKGYEKEHPAIDLLKLKSFTATSPIIDNALTAQDFIAQTAQRLLALKPLNAFLNRALTTEE